MPDLADLYPGYASRWIDTARGRIFARVGAAAGRRFCCCTAIRKAMSCGIAWRRPLPRGSLW